MSCWDKFKAMFKPVDPALPPSDKIADTTPPPVDVPDTIPPPSPPSPQEPAHGVLGASMDKVDCLGYMRDNFSKRDTDKIRGMVVHTTGGGLWIRWAKDNPRILDTPHPEYPKTRYKWIDWVNRKGHETHPYDTAIRVYASIMEAGPHYVVCGDTGRICQTTPLGRSAWHVGRDGRKYYEEGTTNKHWLARWPYKGPLSLLGSHAWNEANSLTIGVEVAPSRSGHKEPWSDACIATLRSLSKELEVILPAYYPQDNTVVSHWDLHPNVRSLSSGLPWDPYDAQWLPAKKLILE